MNRLIKQLGIAEDFSIKTIVSVDELMNHDMIYVYHHLRVGTLLDLHLKGTNVNGDPQYEVCFKEFVLGTITLKGITRNIFGGADSMCAEVSSLSKKKFMPINELDIQLGVSAIKKVG